MTSARLEEESYKSTDPTPWVETNEWVEFRDCRCGCRTCPGCGPNLGHRVRRRLLEQSHLFPCPFFLTLTVDRKRFKSPSDAHAQVTKGGLIARLMRRLGVKRYVWVLEFHTKTGDGWPHWHVLLDAADLPGQRLDYQLVWHLWRDKWGIGGWDASKRKPFQNPAHAINYATKYLTKFPQSGFPMWVLESQTRIRFFQSSRAVGALVARPASPDPPCSEEASTEPSSDPDESMPQPEPARRRPMRPLLERTAECRTRAHAMHVTHDPRTGQQHRKWLRTIDCSEVQLLKLAQPTHHASHLLDERWETKTYADGSTVRRRRPVILPKGADRFSNLVDRVAATVVVGLSSTRQEDINTNLERLLAANQFAIRQGTPPVERPADPLDDIWCTGV